MIGNLLEIVREIERHRTAIAIVIPTLGGGLALASSVLIPSGKARGLLTGAFMFMASLGAACLIFGAAAAISGATSEEITPMILVGIVLTVIMGIFSPASIREYQQFEGRKLAAEIFRRS